MNEQYGRSRWQGSRSRQDESGWEQGREGLRQPSQWQDERFGRRGGWYDDQARNRYEPSNTGDDRPGAYGQSGTGYRQERNAYGQDDYAPQRDYRVGAEHYGNRYGGGFRSFSSNDYGGRDFASDSPSPYGAYGGYAGGTASIHGGYGSSEQNREDNRGYGARDYGGWREYGERRGFFERAGDEIASWFGDEDAARRREQDHRGRGPANYVRSDERIREDANDALTRDWAVDASEITVEVRDGEVTLDGTVHSRIAKRRAEDCVDDVSGVKHVQNNLRVKDAWTAATTTGTTGTGTT